MWKNHVATVPHRLLVRVPWIQPLENTIIHAHLSHPFLGHACIPLIKYQRKFLLPDHIKDSIRTITITGFKLENSCFRNK